MLKVAFHPSCRKQKIVHIAAGYVPSCANMCVFLCITDGLLWSMCCHTHCTLTLCSAADLRCFWSLCCRSWLLMLRIVFEQVCRQVFNRVTRAFPDNLSEALHENRNHCCLQVLAYRHGCCVESGVCIQSYLLCLACLWKIVSLAFAWHHPLQQQVRLVLLLPPLG